MTLAAEPAPWQETADTGPGHPTELQDVNFGEAGNSTAFSVFGWSGPEIDFRWSIGTRSVLCLDRPDAPHGYLMEITWSAFVPHGVAGQAVRIRVGGEEVARCEVDELERVIFRCPALQRHEDRLLVEFEHPNAARPSAVFGETDDRLLALCFRRLRLIRIEEGDVAPQAAQPEAVPEPPASALKAHGDSEVQAFLRSWPPFQPGQAAVADDGQGLDIVFGQDGNALPFLYAGWSGLEAGFIWSIGTEASLLLPRLRRAARYVFSLLAEPFLAGDTLPAQSLAVALNGTRLAEIRASAQFILEVEVPWAVLSARKPAQLSFMYPEAASPSDVLGIRDDRVLGFQFKRLIVTPVHDAPRKVPERFLQAVPATQPAEDLPLQELMTRFESLGQNCEFGLVQRRCGAEPLGLLRFASAPLDKLLPALRCRFAGMGQPGNVTAELTNGEYMILDRIYGLYYHAWVREGEKTPAEIEAREAWRVPFLVRKLLEDLEAGKKLFVFRGMSTMRQADVQALAEAVRENGPATLLWVELADDEHAAGDVYWVEQGLMKAHIDRFAPGENAHDLSLESWITLCRRAWRLFQEKEGLLF